MAAFRTNILRIFCLLCLTDIAATHALAQDSPPVETSPRDKIEQLLSSRDPRLVAWGAHYALATKDQTLVPEMLSLVVEWEALPAPPDDDSADGGLTSFQLDQRDAVAVGGVSIARSGVLSLGSQKPR